MNESQKFVFLYFIKSYFRYINYNQQWTSLSKIPLIKHWRTIFETGLKEAKEDIEFLQYEEFFQLIESRVDVLKIHTWTLSKKSEEFIDEMLSIDEIRVETLKWHLLSMGINDSQSVQLLYKRVFEIWKE